MNRNYREQFVAAQGIYLLNHSVGRPPIDTQQAWANGFLQHWEQERDATWPRWLEGIDSFRGALAQLLGGAAPEFCPQVNLSSALGKVLSCLEARPGKRVILYSEEDFPSMGFVLQQVQQYGYELRCLPAGTPLEDAQVWADALSPELAAVLVTHVQSNTSRLLPVAAITAMARERNIVSVVDIAQSVGAVPINLGQWQADFVLGSCVKWLCGGPGAGFLWVEPSRLQQWQPADVGWFSHENPFEFDIHNFRYAPDALRFWGGTPSVQPYVVAANSINTLCDIGIDTVRSHNRRLNNLLLQVLDSDWLSLPLSPDQRGGTLVLAPPTAQRDSFTHALTEADVAFDERATGVRLSPHIYNTEEEMAVVRSCLPVSA